MCIRDRAWSYSAIREEGKEDENEYNNKIFRTLIGIVILIGIGLITFMKPFLSIYVAKEYYVAWKYTPFLTVGCVYLTLATFKMCIRDSGEAGRGEYAPRAGADRAAQPDAQAHAGTA